jgi:DmsE family decaheme c-type cytochrome
MQGQHQRFWIPLVGLLFVLGLPLAGAPVAIGAQGGSILLGTVGSSAPAKVQEHGSQPDPAATASPATETRPGYVDNSTCIKCHEVEGKTFKNTMMGHLMMVNPRDERERLSCQECHGPGRDHVRHPHKPALNFVTFRLTPREPADVQNDRCLECHQNGERTFWKASTHAFRGVRCVDCHTVMCPVTASVQINQVKTSPLSTQFITPFIVTRNETQVCLRCHLRKKMEINLPSHMPLREGLMTCVDCHNPHGGPYPRQLRAATVNEVCYRCHAEKRGPFLWIHAPVMMNCLNCHNPHGSVNQHMLLIRQPLLCQRCHIGSHHPSTPQKRVSVFVFNQSCSNCHSQIHGSNSPGGRVFTR